METETYQAREVIFREGEYQKWMYSIQSGTVEICSGYGTDEEKALSRLNAGQFFGDVGMLGLMPRTATAVAGEEGACLSVITLEDFSGFLRENPQTVEQIMGNVAHRIRELTDSVSQTNQAIRELMQRSGADAGGKPLLFGAKKLLADLKTRVNSRWDLSAVLPGKKTISDDLPPVVNYGSGQVIFRSGDASDGMYEILGGSIGIYADYGTDNQKLLTRLGSEQVFGEMGLLQNLPRSATAVCLEDCSLLLIRSRHFQSFFEKKPTKVMAILQQMCMRLRDLTREYLKLCQTLEQLQGSEAEADHSARELAQALKEEGGHADWMYF